MKRRLYLAVIGALLSAAALSLGGCSKEKTPDPEGRNDEGQLTRPVLLRIENRSSVSDDRLTIHFSDDESRCDAYRYWSKIDLRWVYFGENQFFQFSDFAYTKDKAYRGDPVEDGGINFRFDGSVLATWHQRVIVSVGRNDQENLIIKATADLKEGQTIETWIPWRNDGREVQIEVVKTKVGKFLSESPYLNVYVHLIITDYKR